MLLCFLVSWGRFLAPALPFAVVAGAADGVDGGCDTAID